MSKRVLLILSHSIEEHDQLKLLSGLGYDVFSLGGYIDPAHPHDDKRPPLPEVKHWPHLQTAVDTQGVEDNIGAAAAHIPDEILEWLGSDGVIICHHYLERIFGQWGRLKEWGGRVVWRTVGQSVEDNERRALAYVKDGMQVVRYSPMERHIPGYAGEDAVIRFYKDPEVWDGWRGEAEHITNVTQQLLQRHPWTNAEFWWEATKNLPTRPVGPGSEALPGGTGTLPWDEMREALRSARAYLYCGTQPASYTLGLLEALMVGVPVVSIGPEWMRIFPYGSKLFEGHYLASGSANDPGSAERYLKEFLDDEDYARETSDEQRAETIAEFGIEKVSADWKAFLG